MTAQEKKQRAAAYSLLKRYNLTLAERDTMLEYQAGLCAICRKPKEHFKNGLHVDHDHSTKLIRGMLCFACNSLIPNRKNLIPMLQRVITYLTLPPAVIALGSERFANKIKRGKNKKRNKQ